MSDQTDRTENEQKIEKLKRWTEKDFPIELREDSKTPYLNQFSDAQLREGIVHVVTARKALGKEFNGLVEIHKKQYSDAKYDTTFKAVAELISKDEEIEWDDAVCIDDDVMEEEDHATAIRKWENDTGFSDERVLRYTLVVISRVNYKIKRHIKGMREAIGAAQDL